MWNILVDLVKEIHNIIQKERVWVKQTWIPSDLDAAADSMDHAAQISGRKIEQWASTLYILLVGLDLNRREMVGAEGEQESMILTYDDLEPIIKELNSCLDVFQVNTTTVVLVDNTMNCQICG